eukprot:COSAG06_NODE_35127_length_464_cov_0.739726_1_plen_82_part_10
MCLAAGLDGGECPRFDGRCDPYPAGDRANQAAVGVRALACCFAFLLSSFLACVLAFIFAFLLVYLLFCILISARLSLVQRST